MSFSERMVKRSGGLRRRAFLAVAGAFAMVLAGCSAQPLYAPAYNTEGVSPTLNRISVEPVDTRVAQQVRNNLMFDLQSQGQPGYTLYNLRLAVSATESPLGVTPVDSAPAYVVVVAATYTVRSLETGDVVLRETVRASASYDRVTQIYANVRAQRDAENRAAAAVANDIRIRLAAAASQGVI